MMISPALSEIFELLENLPLKTQEHVAEILRVYLSRLREGTAPETSRQVVVHSIQEEPLPVARPPQHLVEDKETPTKEIPAGPWGECIVVDPAILMGKPFVKSTRLPVEFILDLLAQGWSEAEILRNYPDLVKEDVRACLQYASAVLKHG